MRIRVVACVFVFLSTTILSACGNNSTLSSSMPTADGLLAGPPVKNGDLYVANAGANTVTVYSRGSTSVLRTISKGVRYPNALAFDRSHNLYVANNFISYGHEGTVTVYAPNSQSVRRTIAQGVNAPNALAFDGSGNAYVANTGTPDFPESTVTVYAPGSKSVSRTISQGVHVPDALAFAGSGNLYVANCRAGCGGNFERYRDRLRPRQPFAAADDLPRRP